ncbi:MAG TPA: hypothetical protein VIK81_04320 [Patescibacteria group bacterium]
MSEAISGTIPKELGFSREKTDQKKEVEELANRTKRSIQKAVEVLPGIRQDGKADPKELAQIFNFLADSFKPKPQEGWLIASTNELSQTLDFFEELENKPRNYKEELLKRMFANHNNVLGRIERVFEQNDFQKAWTQYGEMVDSLGVDETLKSDLRILFAAAGGGPSWAGNLGGGVAPQDAGSITGEAGPPDDKDERGERKKILRKWRPTQKERQRRSQSEAERQKALRENPVWSERSRRIRWKPVIIVGVLVAFLVPQVRENVTGPAIKWGLEQTIDRFSLELGDALVGDFDEKGYNKDLVTGLYDKSQNGTTPYNVIERFSIIHEDTRLKDPDQWDSTQKTIFKAIEKEMKDRNLLAVRDGKAIINSEANKQILTQQHGDPEGADLINKIVVKFATDQDLSDEEVKSIRSYIQRKGK